MRTLECLYLFGGTFLAAFILGLPHQVASSAVVLSLIPIYMTARWRHRRTFHSSLASGDLILSFQKPPRLLEAPMPSRWFRHRSCYEALVLNIDGYETNLDVVIEGTFFGLFFIQILEVKELQTHGPISVSAT